MRGGGSFVPEEFSQDEFITVFTSRKHDAEQEAESIRGLLESAGLESLIVRENVQELPVGRVAIKVLSSNADDAKNLIAEARRQNDPAAGDEEEDDEDEF
jgi:hypothetical protein